MLVDSFGLWQGRGRVAGRGGNAFDQILGARKGNIRPLRGGEGTRHRLFVSALAVSVGSGSFPPTAAPPWTRQDCSVSVLVSPPFPASVPPQCGKIAMMISQCFPEAVTPELLDHRVGKHQGHHGLSDDPRSQDRRDVRALDLRAGGTFREKVDRPQWPRECGQRLEVVFNVVLGSVGDATLYSSLLFYPSDATPGPLFF